MTQTFESFTESQKFFLRALHVDYEDRIVVIFRQLANSEFWIRIWVQIVDECKNTNALLF